MPKPVHAFRFSATGSGQNLGAVLFGIHGIQDDETGVLDPAIGVGKRASYLRFERGSGRVGVDINFAGRRKAFSTAEVIVHEQAKPDQPGGALVRAVGEDEAERPDDVGGRFEQGLALDQRFAHQAEFVMFEIAKTAVDQLGAGGRGVLGEIILLAEDHLEAAACGVARNAGAVDAASDHQQIDDVVIAQSSSLWLWFRHLS